MSSPSVAEVGELHQRAMAALQQRREADAVDAWRRILQLAPDDLHANNGLGRHALAAGRLDEALLHFQHAAQAHGRDPRLWLNLAGVHRRRGDSPAEELAIFEALKADPQDLLALLARGEFHERHGRMAQAAEAYTAASLVAPPAERLAPELRASVAHAFEVRRAHEQRLASYLDGALDSAFREHRGEDLDRFRLSLDILLGRKQRYESRPMRYFVPQLAPVEFFDRSLFPWLEALEAGTDLVRDEFMAVYRSDEGFVPYIQYGADEPVEQWAELNHSPRWSCYHLWKDGKPVPEHAARCPGTLAHLDATPRPDQPGRTPVALFSLLKPYTRIPPHVGASNARLLCHLPLIIPPNCRFRVGNSVREWVPGRAWVFDDTVEHEAHNDSGQLRVILIFDVWHPALTESERRMITAMNAALNNYSGADAAYGG